MPAARLNPTDNMRALFVFSLLCIGATALAQDYAREQRWADQIVPAIVVGEAIYLDTANGHRFLALYGQAKDTAADTLKTARERAGQADDFLRTTIEQRPYTTAAVCLGIGFLIGSLARRDRHW